MRLIFMGTPEFSVGTLKALAADHEICAVYTQPPRPAGRGKKLRPSPVHLAAQEIGAPVCAPLNFKAEEERAAFAAHKADAAIVVAYGLILPQAVLDAPKFGCFNLHASLLPRWRGAAPIQRAIMAGDSESGVCVMRMTLGLDEGPVLARAHTPIAPQETASSLHDRLAQIGAELMAQTIHKMAAQGPLAQTPQSQEGVEYAAKIDKAEARIDWTQDAAALDCKIRGLSPFPGAWFELNGERVKALLCEPIEAEGAPGETLDDRLAVACGRGAIRLLRVQKAGKGAADAADFLRGHPIARGVRLT